MHYYSTPYNINSPIQKIYPFLQDIKISFIWYNLQHLFLTDQKIFPIGFSSWDIVLSNVICTDIDEIWLKLFPVAFCILEEIKNSLSWYFLENATLEDSIQNRTKSLVIE